jgi:hypothetical protein
VSPPIESISIRSTLPAIMAMSSENVYNLLMFRPVTPTIAYFNGNIINLYLRVYHDRTNSSIFWGFNGTLILFSNWFFPFQSLEGQYRIYVNLK